jgi:CheY-like chemotaxis protein
MSVVGNDGWMAIRVLLVDDEPDIRMLVRLMLERTKDIDVVGEAATGEDALVQVAALRPDLILLDQMMPGMTGIETARRILANGGVADAAGHRPRIVMFSAYTGAGLQMEAAEVGVTSCLSKDDFASVPDAIRDAVAD